MEGILPLYKPKGLTSHDCVSKLRRILKIRKIGHTGTLDPETDGVLPICIGRATKVAQYITDAGKAYEGEVTLGISTTTEDASGDIVAVKPVERPITKEEILGVLSKLTGEISQTPPMYSAVKVNGKKLYEYARQGIEVERPTRTVMIYSLDLLDDREIFSGEKIAFRFRAECSKGTYIRTLAVTIGEMLGYPAHMSDLTRIKAASFTLSDCLTFEQIKEKAEAGVISEELKPLEAALTCLPKYQIHDKLIEKVKNGAVFPTPADWKFGNAHVAVIDKNGKVYAIYEAHPKKSGLIKPVKVLAD